MKYTVKPGDTLSGIAKKRLGDATRWREVYSKNRDRVGKDPDHIEPGQVLDVPLNLWAVIRRIFK